MLEKTLTGGHVRYGDTDISPTAILMIMNDLAWYSREHTQVNNNDVRLRLAVPSYLKSIPPIQKLSIRHLI